MDSIKEEVQVLVKQKEKVSLFWFRRDLRVEDNTALVNALNSGVSILPIFIFDTDILDELDNALSKIEFNTNIKSIIITGAGKKAFVAGADITEMAKMNKKEAYNYSLKGQKLFSKIEFFEYDGLGHIGAFWRLNRVSESVESFLRKINSS